MHRTAVLAVLAAIPAAAGCGSAAPARPAEGPALFTEDCSACHSLTGHQSPRRQGGDLLDFHAGRGAMLQFVAEMPVRHPLSAAQVRAVADYLRSAEDQGR